MAGKKSKRNTMHIYQAMFTLLLVGIALLIIFALANGIITTQNGNVTIFDTFSGTADNSSHSPHVTQNVSDNSTPLVTEPARQKTFSEYIDDMPEYNSLYTEYFNTAEDYVPHDTNYAVLRVSAPSLGNLGGASLEVENGLIVKKSSGAVTYFNADFEDITALIEGYTHTGLTDENGNLLFERDGKYYIITPEHELEKSRPADNTDVTYDGLNLPLDYNVIKCEDGVITLEKDGKYGYMDYYSAAWITDPVYSDASGFHGGLGVCGDENGKYGIVDKKGNVIAPLIFDSAQICTGGTAILHSTQNGYYFLKVMKRESATTE